MDFLGTTPHDRLHQLIEEHSPHKPVATQEVHEPVATKEVRRRDPLELHRSLSCLIAKHSPHNLQDPSATS